MLAGQLRWQCYRAERCAWYNPDSFNMPGVVGQDDDGGRRGHRHIPQVGDVQRAALPEHEAAAVALVRGYLPPAAHTKAVN